MQRNHRGYGQTPGKFVTDYVSRDDATESLIMDPADAGLTAATAASMVAHGYSNDDIDTLSATLGIPLHGMYRSFGNDGLNYDYDHTVAVAQHIQSLYQRGLTIQRLVVSFKDDQVLQQLGVSNQQHHRRGDYRNHVDELKLRQGLNYGMQQLAAAGHFSRPVWIGAVQVDTDHVHAHLVIVDDVSIAASQRQWHHREQRGELYRHEIAALRQGIAQQLHVAPTACFSNDLASHDVLTKTATIASIGMQQRHAQLLAQPSAPNRAEYQQPTWRGYTPPHDYQQARALYQQQPARASKLTTPRRPFSPRVQQLRTAYQQFNRNLQQAQATYQHYLDYQMTTRSMPVRDAWRQFYQQQLAYRMAVTDKYRWQSDTINATPRTLTQPVTDATARLSLAPADLLWSLQHDQREQGSHQVAVANTTAHWQLWSAGLVNRQRVLADMTNLNHGRFVTAPVAPVDNFVNDYTNIKNIDRPVSCQLADVQQYQQGLTQRQHDDATSLQLLQRFYKRNDQQLQPVQQQLQADNDQLAALQAWQAQQAATSEALLLQQQNQQLDALLASQRSAASARAASQAAAAAQQASQASPDEPAF